MAWRQSPGGSEQHLTRAAAAARTRTQRSGKHLAVHASELVVKPDFQILRRYRRPLLLRLEHTHRPTLEDHVHRATRLGSSRSLNLRFGITPSNGSCTTVMRFTFGAISRSRVIHLPAITYSKVTKPVALPPGLARLDTKPPATGSKTCTKTIGTVRVCCSNVAKTDEPAEKMTSGASATNSAVSLRTRTGSPAGQRMSICKLRPSLQPSS